MNKLATVQKNGSSANLSRFQDFPDWSSWIDNMFSNELPTLMMSNFNTGMTLPKVNIRETLDAYFVDVAVPGMKKEDFRIDLDNYILSISSETSYDQESNQDDYKRREFGYSAFKRTFTLPESIEENEIKATYEDGVLKVHLPKKEEAKQKPPRVITIS